MKPHQFPMVINGEIRIILPLPKQPTYSELEGCQYIAISVKEKLRWFGFSERLSSAKPIFRRCLIFLLLKKQICLHPLKGNRSQSLISTRAEIREKFGVKDSWIYKVVAENNVPKTILRGKAYFSKSHIDRLFSARKENPEITEWYSVEDIQSKYGMTLSAIYSLVSKIGIPKRKEGPKVYYSKYHFDVAKGAKSAEDVEFISVADAMGKYSLTRDQLYNYVKTYKITKLRCGKYIKLNAKELSELFNPKIEL